MKQDLASNVRSRAGERCEYCLLPRACLPTIPFPIDHVIAQQHRGPTTSSNLALTCLHCNSHKGPNLSGIDPVTRKLTRLFHPRRHSWNWHFRWDGPLIVGKTAIGRTTVVVLAMNDPDRVRLREELMREGEQFR